MKIDFSTRYLGLKLSHPLVVGASPLVDNLDRVREIEDAGAAAIVMHSLFEEQILMDNLSEETYIEGYAESFSEATSYFPGASSFALNPETYLTRIQKIKEMVSMPVIGSLNGKTPSGWTDYARDIESAGADALELNLYSTPTLDETDPNTVEASMVSIVRAVCEQVKIPVAVKLSPYITSLPHFIRQLEGAGANAVVLFNRFYQPDIDIEELETVPSLKLSESPELLLRLRWLAILRDNFTMNLSCSGGVHTTEDIIKSIMSGADSVQLVSALLKLGVGHIRTLLNEVEDWMDAHEYESIRQMKGSMSYRNSPNPEAIERANYVKVLTTAQVQDRFGPVKC